MNAQNGALIAGNWKSVNMTLAKTDAWVDAFGNLDLASVTRSNLHILLFPPMSAATKLAWKLSTIPSVQPLLQSKQLLVGGQDMDPIEGDKERFTGSHHPNLLLDLGMTHVLIGHSERRHKLLEPDNFITQKVQLALKYNLIPILCVGETLEEFDAGKTKDVITRQLGALSGIAVDIRKTLVVAYEPVWAIGTGKTATPESANSICEFIRTQSGVGKILYGGSVTSSNAADFFAQPHIDGALPGGASEKPEEFFGIVKAAVDRI